MNALRRLIRSRMDELGLTYAEVGKRGGLPASTVYNLASREELRQPPRPATIAGLSKGLGVPLDVVRTAAAEAAGYKFDAIEASLDTGARLRIIAARMGEMSERDQEMLVHMAERFANAMKVEEEEAQAQRARKRGPKP